MRSPPERPGGLALVALSGPRTREPAGLLFVLPFKIHCSVKHSARPGRREYTVMRRDAAEMRGTRAENRDARTERRPRDARVRVRETGNQRCRSTGGRVGRASRTRADPCCFILSPVCAAALRACAAACAALIEGYATDQQGRRGRANAQLHSPPPPFRISGGAPPADHLQLVRFSKFSTRGNSQTEDRSLLGGHAHERRNGHHLASATPPSIVIVALVHGDRCCAR